MLSPSTAGILGLLALLVLFMCRFPVAFAMATVGFAGFSYLTNPVAGFSMVSMEIYSAFTSYYYASAIMFIWMGFVAYHIGISRNLYTAMHTLVGHIRGGLAMTTIVACGVFGAICGSTLATTAAIGAISLPEMERYKYSPALAAGTVAAGGILGTTIPPSIPLIVYGIFTEQSIGKLFVGVIVPGMVLMLSYLAAVYIMTTYNPSLGPQAEKKVFREKLRAIFSGGTGETIVVFVIVLGGLFADLFTPTEAGAVGTFSILLVGIIRRRLTWKHFIASLADAAKTSAMVFLLVVGAEIFGSFMAVSQLPSFLTIWAGNLPLPPVFVISLILLFQVILGCFMDGIAVLLLSLPIVFPAAVSLGYDPIWLGIMMIVVAGLGMITPPVGLNAYIVHGMAPHIPLPTIFKGITPFVLAIIVCVILFIVFPQIVLFLPNAMSGL
jgi:tripartite ATP-independent transporter DctM subunit